MFFKKGMFGAFILPFISFSIILSLVTFLFSIYLITKNLISRSLITGYSIYTETPIITFQEINLYPSVIIFYFVILFTLSIAYSLYVLKKTKYEKDMNIKKFFHILFYILVYLSLYPLVWFASIHRFVKKDHKW